MAFDMSTAKPMDQPVKKGFDMSTAKPMASDPEAQIPAAIEVQQPEKIGIGSALWSGMKRGAEKTALGITQRILEYVNEGHKNEIDEFASKMQSGEIPATKENIDKLDAMQNQAIIEAKAMMIGSDYEKSARDKFAPVQKDRPIASFIGDVGGQIAAAPIPAVRGALGLQMAKGAVEGAATAYAQPTTGEEKGTDNVGLGAAIGGAFPAVLRPITTGVGAAYRGVVGRPAQEVEDVIRHADEQGLPLMTSDVLPPTTFSGKAAQSLGGKIPVAGTGAARAEQQAARSDQIRQLSEQYGVPNDQEIVTSLNRKANRLSAAAGNRYENIINDMDDTPIPLNNTVNAIDAQIARYTAPGSAQNPAVTNALQEFRDQITSGDNNLALLRQNRTLFRELIRGGDTIMTDSARRANDAVYRAMTQDMQDGVAATLGRPAANALRQVDGIWARESQELKNTKLKNIFSKGEIKPEEATKMLFSNDRSEAETLFNALDTAGRQNARAAIINKAVEKSADSPERFISEMNKLRNQSGIFFRGPQRRQLDGLIRYLNYTREAGRASTTTKSGQELMQVGVPAGIFADFAATGGSGTIGFATIGAASRFYESRPMRNLMVRMSSVPRGSTEFEILASAFEREVQRAATKAAITQNPEEAQK